ncbi:hypothetical protein ACH5RR_029815 [Cinchona calisaya]|uniref:Leucine-rich repeat-containing N-terminal plant-type domain-containing protein n=1 Tax=Cinchona calisaya TaxID=153742 RepID=A0ABD2YW01_9GENT
MRHFLGTPFIMFLFILLFISQIRVLGEAYSNVTCIESERKALVQFRQSLIDSKSNRLSSWTGEECCVWEGVDCSKSTGHVVKVDLHNPMLFDESEYDFNPEYYYSNFSNNCLGGQLNPSLVNLKYL